MSGAAERSRGRGSQCRGSSTRCALELRPSFRCGGSSRIGVRGCRQAPGGEDAWYPLFVRDIVLETSIVEWVPRTPPVPEHWG